MTSPTSRPEWRKAWKLDDKEWMKQRRKQWRELKPSVEIASWFLTKDDKKRLKNFFMTGSAFDPELPEEKWGYYAYHPDSNPVNVGARVLFESWLTADQSEENWAHIREKYDELSMHDSRSRFRELYKYRYPKEGRLFGDLEERLYTQLGPIRCRPEDYPEGSYSPRAYSVYRTFLTIFMRNGLFAKGIVNEDHGLMMFIREWCDSFEGLYDGLIFEHAEKENPEEALGISLDHFENRVMARICEFANKSEIFQPLQVKFAQEVLENLKGVPMHDEIETRIDKCLSQYGVQWRQN